jgi:hypothetical protein
MDNVQNCDSYIHERDLIYRLHLLEIQTLRHEN